jgi:hypothetical protein
MGKKECQRSHFKRRLFERYEITVNDGEYDFLVSKVKKNDKEMVHFLMKQSNRITINVIEFKGKRIVAVYDKLRKALCTCLPPECEDVKNIFSYIQEIEE